MVVVVGLVVVVGRVVLVVGAGVVVVVVVLEIVVGCVTTPPPPAHSYTHVVRDCRTFQQKRWLKRVKTKVCTPSEPGWPSGKALGC